MLDGWELVETDASDISRPDWVCPGHIDTKGTIPILSPRFPNLPEKAVSLGTYSESDLGEIVKAVAREEYRERHRKPLWSKLPFHYHHFPPKVRALVASVLLKFRSVEGFPGGNFNPGLELLAEHLERMEKNHREGEPSDKICVLTHDIDTPLGYEVIPTVVQIEKQFRFRSSWNAVGCHVANKKSVLKGLLNDGFEIGLHGFWHDNTEAFLSVARAERELDKLTADLRELEITGYRSPSWFRTPEMFSWLAKFFSYDSSTLDCDTACPGGHGGVGLMRPFRYVSGLREIPCTLPFELPIFLGVPSERLLDYWKPKIEFAAQFTKILVVNTHPDPGYLHERPVLGAYEALLEYLHEDGWSSTLPKDIPDEYYYLRGRPTI